VSLKFKQNYSAEERCMNSSQTEYQNVGAKWPKTFTR